jgi:tRNA G10  N-methylase Trm11
MYLFLLGRDPDLSKLEIVNYFSSRNIKFNVIAKDTTYLILDFLEKDSKYFLKIDLKNICNDLAGITRVVEISDAIKKLDYNLLIDIFKVDSLFLSNKFNYSLSTINLNQNYIGIIQQVLKDYFKLEKTKAVFKKPKSFGKEKHTVSSPDNYYSWKLENGFELFIVYNEIDGLYYLGHTISCFNSKVNVFKDKNRPQIKNLYNTSFRLVDILINILELKKGSTVVDPFCGTGTFIIEGLIKGYNMVGIDKSKDMCYCSEKNVKWASKEYNIKNTYKIINVDSTIASFKADGAFFEPYMGPFLFKLPPPNKAKQIINELNALYFNVFKNLSLRLKDHSKMVCILPIIKSSNDKLFTLRKDLFTKTGFKLVDVSVLHKDIILKNPILYSSPSGSKLERRIYYLEKY